MNQEVKIVIGSAHGDEGKGVTVQHLCKQAIGEGKKPLVIRFSGGPQAGHTINYNGIEHIC
jgi:adenylosuccinate synthase